MNLVDLVPATEDALFYIAVNLRERDAEEIFATRWSDDPEVLTKECMWVVGQPSSVTVIARLNKEPVAILGAVESWPGTWEVWCFGTEIFDQVAFSLTKYVRRVLIPLLLRQGLRRGHCRSMAHHSKAHAWLRSLGARVNDDHPLKNYGKNGEDFVMFEWHRADLLKTYKLVEAA